MEKKLIQQYINIHISIPEEFYEYVYAYLTDFRFSGIEEKFDEIIISFPIQEWSDLKRINLNQILYEVYPSAKIIKEEIIADRNWAEDWEKNLPSIIVNDRIGIAPVWKKDELTQDIKIIINPKMSFGTGHHATTRLMCKLMENIVKPDSFWIDAGTGTGVLAILAILLGAKRVLAFDNNSWSLENAEENIAYNQCSDKIELVDADVTKIQLPDANGIAANLYTHLLFPSLKKFYNILSSSKGDLIVSGILVYDLDEVITKAQDAGFKHITTLHEDEWVAIHFGVI